MGIGITDVALGITLSLAALTDWREHRIYNKLLGPAFLLALFLQILQHGWAGLWQSLTGTFVGFALLLIPYFLGGIGAGDVKLLAVIGAFGGPQFVVVSFLYGAVIGGVVSTILLARRKAFLATLQRFLLFLPFLSRPTTLRKDIREARQEKFPYGIALALGTMIAMFGPLQRGW